MTEAAKSKFEQVRDALLEEIKKGVYERSLKLPSESELIERFGIARETARKAIFDLVRRGLVERRKGAGSFIIKQGQRRSGLIGLLMPDASSARIFRDFVVEIKIRRGQTPTDSISLSLA